MKVAIIGTAGRKEDVAKISRPFYVAMKQAVTEILGSIPSAGPILISGGAAVSDHIAVQLFNESPDYELHLHLPALFSEGMFQEGADRYDPGRTANYYHRLFSERCQIHSLTELGIALSTGAIGTVTPGFKERNIRVAEEAEMLIALTFGHKNVLKDGGTADTVRKYLHLGKKAAFHVDLNTMVAHPDAAVQ